MKHFSYLLLLCAFLACGKQDMEEADNSDTLATYIDNSEKRLIQDSWSRATGNGQGN